MRNPLTAALAAMALHTVAAVALGWPFPSVATFLAGILAVAGTVLAASRTRLGLGTATGLAVFAPALVPLPLLTAGIAAAATRLFPCEADPLRNLAIALPALAVLVLGPTL